MREGNERLQNTKRSLFRRIAWALTHPLPPQELRRCVIRRYSESVVARQYMNLYNQIMK